MNCSRRGVIPVTPPLTHNANAWTCPNPARAGERAGRIPVRQASRQPRSRGAGWQRGQEWEERFMKCSRTIGVPHRGHGRPCCP